MKTTINNFLLKKKIKKYGLGLALGGGDVRGFFHIGVLQALEEKKIPISFIAGVSIGSLLGSIYAMGYSADELLDIIENKTQFFQLLTTFDLNILPKTGIFSGAKIIDEINTLAGNRTIEELNIPFICRAADILHFKEVVFSQGDIGLAVKASCSIPGFFSAVEYNHQILVDGSVLGPVPIQLIKKYFHGPILASNLIAYDSLDDEHAHKVNRSIKDDLLSRILPVADPVIKSFLLIQSRITALEYQITPPDISVQFSGLYHPTLSNMQKIKYKLINDGYQTAISALEKIGL